MKSSFQVSAAILILLLVCVFACSKNSADKVSGTPGVTPVCDTVDMKYSANVLPILESYCYGCHGNGNTGGSGGINLDGYNNLLKWVNNGYLIGDILSVPGYTPMPYGQPSLSTCNLNIIVDWVSRGAPNN